MQNILEAAIRRLLPRLNINDADILKTRATELIGDIQKAFSVEDSDMQLQLQATGHRDAMAIINLLLPRVEEEKLHKLASLDMLFDERYTNLQWEKCHREKDGRYDRDRVWAITNLDSNYNLLRQTIQSVAHKLHPNWMDIIPVPLNTYQKSDVFKGTQNAFSPRDMRKANTKDYNKDRIDTAKTYMSSDTKNIITPAGALSIRDMWSVVSGDLFTQVLAQKPLIYDYNLEGEVGKPVNALLIWDRLLPLDCSYDALRWVDMSDSERYEFTTRWDSVLEHADRRISYVLSKSSGNSAITSTTLLRMLRVLAITAKSQEERLFRETEWENKYELKVRDAKDPVTDENRDYIILVGGDSSWGRDIRHPDIQKEVKTILDALRTLPAQAWYMVFSKAIQDIQLGWYGLLLFDTDKDTGKNRPIKLDFSNRDMKVCTEEDMSSFLSSNIGNTENGFAIMRKTMQRSGYPLIVESMGKPFYLTVKNIYNWAKSVTHQTDKQSISKKDKFIQLSQHWDTIELVGESPRLRAINRLFGEVLDIGKWLNLSNYYLTTYEDYGDVTPVFDLDEFHESLIRTMTMILPNIAVQALIKRGTLTQFRPIPNITDEDKYSGSSEKRGVWLQSKLAEDGAPLHRDKLREYGSSYNFVTGKVFPGQYLRNLAHDDKTNWYTTYAMNWVSQISLFHRFLNCRHGMVTGATGVGKSTQAPKLMLYALRALEGRNSATVICTEPRIDPTKKNATRVAEEMGVPIMQPYGGKVGNGESGNQGVGYKFSGGELGLGNPIQLTFCTDGSKMLEVLSSPMFRSIRKQPSKTNNKNEAPKYVVGQKNLCNIFMIDESHEHNIYMDLILSRVRPHLQFNTELRFLTISATLTEFDERRYRSFFRDINDNYRYPFRPLPDNSDRVDVDRLIHIAAPFMGTRYEITKMPYIEVMHGREPNDPGVMAEIIQNIAKLSAELSQSNRQGKSDVIVFLPGAREIIQCCEAINSTPELKEGTIAIPYYKSLSEDVRTLMTKIDKKDSRDKIVWSRRDTLNVLIDGDLENKSKYPTGYSYKQFILVATNIAESSITIDTLRYMIDSGMSRTVTYNPTTRTEKMDTIMISQFNATQRTGRLGRTMTGTAYYLYDPSKLNEGSLSSYAISSSDLSEQLLQMLDPNIYSSNDLMYSAIKFLADETVTDISNKKNDKLKAAIMDYWYINNSERIDAVNKGMPAHRDDKDLEDAFMDLSMSQFAPIAMAHLLYDYEMRIYCFHPEEPYLKRNKAGKVINVELSKTRNIYFKSQMLRGVKSKVILSDLIDDSKLRLEQLGLIAMEKISLHKLKDNGLDAYLESTKHDYPGLLALNDTVLTLTTTGRQIQALSNIIRNELPSDGEMNLTLNDTVMLLYAERYGCMVEALRLQAALDVCNTAAGPNLMAWAPTKHDINPKTGRMRRIIDTDPFFAAYKHQTSDHLALLRITNVIEPLYRKIYGDSLSGKSKIDQAIEHEIRAAYRGLLKYKQYVTIVNRVIMVNVPGNADFSARDLKDLRKIVADLEKYPLDPSVAYTHFIMRKRNEFTRKHIMSFFNSDINNHRYVEEFARAATLSVNKIYQYMERLQFLQTGIYNIKNISDEIKRREYPNVDIDLLTFKSNLDIYPASKVEEAVMRCMLYANPEKIAAMEYRVLYYNQNISLQTPELFKGGYNGFAEPHGLCMFTGIAETSKLADVNPGIEIVTADSSASSSISAEKQKPIKAGVMASVFTNIPHEWVGQCNPQMNIDVGFKLNNLERRAKGLETYHNALLRGENLTMAPWKTL